MKRLIKNFQKTKDKKQKEGGLQKPLRESLYISAFPKSGSTYIVLVANQILKYSRENFIYDYLGEQDLYAPILEANAHKNTISKHHTLATKPNVALFKEYKINPVVLTRNLPDVVVSLRDHIEKTLQWPHFEVPKDFGEWEEEKQFDLLIDLALPGYIFFYVSWINVSREKELKTKFVRYEDFYMNKASTIKEIIEFWGRECSLKAVEESMVSVNELSNKKNRINKAVMDRGRQSLSEAQQKRIIKLTTYYSDVDFSPIL